MRRYFYYFFLLLYRIQSINCASLIKFIKNKELVFFVFA